MIRRVLNLFICDLWEGVKRRKYFTVAVHTVQVYERERTADVQKREEWNFQITHQEWI